MPCTPTRQRERRARPRSIALAASLACGGLGLGAPAAVAAACPSATRTDQTRVCPTATPGPLLPKVVPTDPVAVLAGGPITRTRVLSRAENWVLQAVPYSQSRWWTDANGTYRQDCSGYVAMSWHLDQRVNYWTGDLATVSSRIASGSLRPGDILLLPRRHVVIFAGWAGNGLFNLYEEFGSGHPARYVVQASLAYYLDRGYGAFRYDNIVDAAPTGDPEMTPASAVRNLGAAVRPLLWSPELAEDHEPAGPGATWEARTESSDAYVVVAALGLLFLTYPLLRNPTRTSVNVSDASRVFAVETPRGSPAE